MEINPAAQAIKYTRELSIRHHMAMFILSVDFLNIVCASSL